MKLEPRLRIDGALPPPVMVWCLIKYMDNITFCVRRSREVIFSGGKASAGTIQVMKVHRGNRGIAPLILNLDTKWW
jgi:hypothetical protein